MKQSSTSEKVCIIGGGSFGSAISTIVGPNVTRLAKFDPVVSWWIFEEEINGIPLHTIVNNRHENVRYLPNVQLPTNVVASPDMKVALAGATIIIIAVPHQFLGRICAQAKPYVPHGAVAVSLVKGVDERAGQLICLTDIIEKELGVECNCLMGANTARDVALQQFSEATLGVKSKHSTKLLLALFNRETFVVSPVEAVHAVELCGALKNIVALGAGFCDGLQLGANTKAAVIRIGLCEMKLLISYMCDNVPPDLFFHSCGVADVTATCYGGRNRLAAAAFVSGNKTWEQLEQELLDGQRLQGPGTCLHVMQMLNERKLVDKFPLFRAIHRIAFEGWAPTTLFKELHQMDQIDAHWP